MPFPRAGTAVNTGTRPQPGLKHTFECEDLSGLGFLFLNIAMERLPGARLQQPLHVLQTPEVAGFVFCGPGMLIQHTFQSSVFCAQNTSGIAR